MTNTLDHVVDRRLAFPTVAALPSLPVKTGREFLTVTLPALTPRKGSVLSGRLPLPKVMPGRLATPFLREAEVSPLPAMAMSVARIAGERLPVLEAVGHHLLVKTLKDMADLSSSDRLMKVDAHGQATLLDDNDVIDLMDDCELEVARRSWAS